MKIEFRIDNSSYITNQIGGSVFFFHNPLEYQLWICLICPQIRVHQTKESKATTKEVEVANKLNYPRNGNNSGTPNPGSGNKNIINTENGLIEKKNRYYKNI